LSGARWITEELHDALGLHTRYAATGVIHEDQTGQQHLVVFDTEHFGRVLMLDGAVQLTTADEFIYHEMIAHMPLFAHGRAQEVLIIGGGDGGAAREVLRHDSVKKVIQVEIDRGVVDLCLKYLPEVSAGAFDDPRLDLIIGDGAAYVKTRDSAFDVIIVDSTDPIGPGAILFTPEFYTDCAAALAPGGVLVTQNGVPFMQPGELKSTYDAFKSIFATSSAYIATVPSYVGGPMAFGWGGNDPSLLMQSSEDLELRYDEAGFKTRYYSPSMHNAAFILPPYIGALLIGS